MKLPLYLALAAATLTLTACSNASAAQVEACNARGGEVVSEYFIYKAGGDGFFESEIESGSLEFCKSRTGTIGEVYNDEVLEATTGFFSDEDNNAVFDACKKRNGRVYETTEYSNDQTHYYWLCVQDGRVLNLISY